jgi:hypothetical protein
MVQLSATRCSCVAISWVSIVSFFAITLSVASQRVIPKVSVYFVIDSVRKLLDTDSYIRRVMWSSIETESFTSTHALHRHIKSHMKMRPRVLFPLLCVPQWHVLWKANIKLSLCFIATPWRRIGGVEVQIHEFLTLALDESEWSTARPWERQQPGWAPKTVWTRWRSPSLQLTGIELRPSSCNLVTIPVKWNYVHFGQANVY